MITIESGVMKMRIAAEDSMYCIIQSEFIFLSPSKWVRLWEGWSAGGALLRQMGIMTSHSQSWNIPPVRTMHLTLNITNDGTCIQLYDAD